MRMAGSRSSKSSKDALAALGKPLERDDSWGAVYAAAQPKEQEPEQDQGSRQSTSTTSEWEVGGDLDRAIKDFGQIAPQPTPAPVPVPSAVNTSPNLSRPPPIVPLPALPLPPALPSSLFKPLSPPTTPSSRKPTHLSIAVGLPQPGSLPSRISIVDASKPQPETAPLQIRRRPSEEATAVVVRVEDGPSTPPVSSASLEKKSEHRRASSSALAILAKSQSDAANLVLPKGDAPRSTVPRQLLTTRAARAMKIPRPIRHGDLADKMMQCLHT